MKKPKEKLLTRSEVRRMIRRESTAIMKTLIAESVEKMSTKLDAAVGFKYVPPENDEDSNELPEEY
jgi:hypothetical protein